MLVTYSALYFPTLNPRMQPTKNPKVNPMNKPFSNPSTIKKYLSIAP